MELSQIKKLLVDPRALRQAITGEKNGVDTGKVKQFDIRNHDVLNELTRPRKKVNKTYMENGETKTKVEHAQVARLPVPFQKRIVDASAAFLCGNPIELVCNPVGDVETRLLEAVRSVWDNNKLDYESKKLAKLMMSQTEVAELWYPDPETKELKMRILESNEGSALYPVFDMYGDLIAFGRAYDVRVEGQQQLHFDIYTADTNYFFKTVFGQWVEAKKPEANPNKKIPIIYYAQEDVEWADVQALINRFETLISNHADTNDYFGSPIVKFRGNVTGVGDKYEQGKAFQLNGEGADANYLTWDQSPESVKLEYNNLKSLIMDFTATPDLSMETMKSLGTYSGIALKMLFMSAHLKAADKEEIFGKGVQRRLNFIKSAEAAKDVRLASAKTLSIKPRFTYYLPQNVQEDIDLIAKAKSAGMLSQESAVQANPLVEDAEAELEKLKAENEQKIKEEQAKTKPLQVA